MKTSLIRYRVADFLRESPPFDTIAPDDLLTLAATGKVLFHESDEFVYRQGAQPKGHFWVTQQGSIDILGESPEGRPLQDMLGAGDVLGLDGLLGRHGCASSARTNSDVILYSIDAAAFKVLMARHPAVADYLASHASLQAQPGEPCTAAAPAQPRLPALVAPCWLDAAGPPADYLAARLRSAQPSEPLAVALRRVGCGPTTTLVVIDPSALAR